MTVAVCGTRCAVDSARPDKHHRCRPVFEQLHRRPHRRHREADPDHPGGDVELADATAQRLAQKRPQGGKLGVESA